MVVPLPTSLATGHEPSADEFQAMLDLLAALTGLTAPVSTTSSGTASSGTTETRDAVLGDYVFTVPSVAATWRYEAILSGCRISSSVADDLYLLRIRDGGASTPTSASTLVAEGSASVHVSGGSGQFTVPIFGPWVPGAGTHTLSLFTVRSSGAGAGTPVSQNVARSLYVRFVGTN